MSLRLRPTTLTEAKAFVGRHHRHNEPPVFGLFAVGVSGDGQTLCAVAIVGRPEGRGLDDGWTCAVTRLASDGTYNACTILYGAAARAARALGYQSIVTYTLANEPGTGPKAAGWDEEEQLPERPTWNCPARQRSQTNLFGEARRPPGPKVRWRKWLTKSKATRKPRPRLRGLTIPSSTPSAPSSGEPAAD